MRLEDTRNSIKFGDLPSFERLGLKGSWGCGDAHSIIAS